MSAFTAAIASQNLLTIALGFHWRRRPYIKRSGGSFRSHLLHASLMSETFGFLWEILTSPSSIGKQFASFQYFNPDAWFQSADKSWAVDPNDPDKSHVDPPETAPLPPFHSTAAGGSYNSKAVKSSMAWDISTMCWPESSTSAMMHTGSE